MSSRKRLAGFFTALAVSTTTLLASADPAPKAALNAQETAVLFGALDANHDGAITREELLAAIRRHLSKCCQERIAKLDHNRDGRVSRDEVPGMKNERFARFDINRDGAFTAAELNLVMARQATDRLAQLFASMDSDASGTFNVGELQAHRALIVDQNKRAPSAVANSNTKTSM